MSITGPYKIAVVDDDVIVRTLIETLFMEVEIFRIDYFPSGESFLESFMSKSYDAIILDHDFHGEDAGKLSGTQILRIIRDQSSSVPVLMLTGQENMNVALDLVSLDVADYIQKKDLYFDRLYDSLVDVIEYQTNQKELSKNQGTLVKMNRRLNFFIATGSVAALFFLVTRIF